MDIIWLISIGAIRRQKTMIRITGIVKAIHTGICIRNTSLIAITPNTGNNAR